MLETKGATVKYIVAALYFFGGIALAIYVSVFIVLLNGITDVVNGAKANPTNAGKIAWGIIQIVPLAELSAAGILLVFWALAAASTDRGNPFRGTGRWPHF